MSESLVPGSTFAGCRLEAVGGRGGMGVVFRATQIALQRPVALKAIVPDLAADLAFRERFQRESQLAASIDHPNVIPVYEAGELDGTLYLIMRWVEGTDLRTLLATGRLSPGRAIKLLRPVASALAAAHAHGLVHRDVKPGNVLIARGPEEDDDHVYLTDFGIARRTDSESITRTAVFVGTVDYTAPERLQGGKGDAASDIYSFGCVLYETLTGHVPYERPSAVSTIYAHVADPIPSARDKVSDIPEQLDAIIARAMAKRPEDRFGSARELAAALGEALQALDTAERAVAVGEPSPDVTDPSALTVTTEDALTRVERSTTHGEPIAATTHAEPAATVDQAATVIPPQANPPQASRVEAGPAPAQTSRRSPFLWLVPIVLLSLVGVLIATFSDVRSNPASTAATVPPSSSTASKRVTLQGGGMTVGRTIRLAAVPGSVSIGSRNLWVSLPDRGELVRTTLKSGARSSFPASGRPTALAAGSRALWVAPSAIPSLAQFNGDSGAQVHSARLNGRPRAIALAQKDSTVWVADSSGAISHIDVGAQGAGTPAPVIGTPAHTDPAATSLAWGEGWLWATTGSANGIVRVSLDTSGSSTAYRGGQHPVAVTLDQGVWIANENGHVTRFDPRPGQLRVDADIRIAPKLDTIAGTDPGPFVWALSMSQKTVYRVTNTSKPTVTGRIVFNSAPVALAVSAHALWIATQDRNVTEIRF
jgi:serine/threonine protein kinase